MAAALNAEIIRSTQEFTQKTFYSVEAYAKDL